MEPLPRDCLKRGYPNSRRLFTGRGAESPEMRALAAIGLIGLAFAPPAGAGNAALVRAVDARLPAVRDTQEDARSHEGHAVQRQYDAARDLAEAVRGAGRVATGCRALTAAANALAAAEIDQAQGVDALAPGQVRAGVRAAGRAWAAIAAARAACVHAGEPQPETLRRVALTTPQANAVVPGKLVVSARAPAGAAWATIAVGPGRLDCKQRVEFGTGRRLARALAVGPGRRDVRVGFCAAHGLVAAGEARGGRVLPASAARPVVRPHTDPRAAARLAAVARTFKGFSGVWSRDLATGRTAGANDEARFPAASTVKLGVLVATLRRFGPRAETSVVG